MKAKRRNILMTILCFTLLIVEFMDVLAQEKSSIFPPIQDRVDQIKNPVDWFNWGADVRFRHESIENPSLTTADPPGHSYSFERLRIREWNTINPCKGFDLNLRFTWEGRHYWLPASKAEWDKSEIIIDNINGKFTFQEIPLTIIVGRQDIVFGDGWLISDGTPLDGPRTTFFDAIRATFDLTDIKSKLDLIYINQSSDPNSRLAPIFSKNISLMEQDERAAIFNFSYKLIEYTQIEPYFIYKHDEAANSKGDNGDVYVLGSRLERDINSNISCLIEGAYQFGNRKNAAMFPHQDSCLSAFGINSSFTYNFRDSLKNQIWLGYAVLSGNDAHDPHNHQFDPLWGRWAQYSELFPNEFDRSCERSNLHRINIGYQRELVSGMLVQVNYSALIAYANRFSGTSGFSDNGKFKGQLLTALLKYQYDRCWSGLLLGEYFIPGNYYETPSGGGLLSTRNDPATFLRFQIVFTF